jgi:cytochrome oxidase Cu insertion factor (SCO1/SenC/PrrC family)
MNTPDPLAVRRGRRQFLLLAALFFVPLALAFWLYYGPGGWRPDRGTNMGELIDPPRALPQADLPIAGGSPPTSDLLRGKWTTIYVGDGACDAGCRKALYLTRQSRTALNKDADRVRRVFLVTGNCCDDDLLEREHPDLVVALLGGKDGANLLEQFPVYSDGPVATAGRIYLVDPLGNLLMSYPATAPDKALLTDLKKLLRLSHIG